MGYKVLSNIRNNFDNELDLKKIVSCIRNCKVFISCISDEYAESDHTRMEMQYVRNTGKFILNNLKIFNPSIFVLHKNICL